MEKQGSPRVSLWKEDALAAVIFALGLYVAPLLAFSLERVVRAFSVPDGICLEGRDEDRAYDEARQRADDDAREQAERDLKNADWWAERLADPVAAEALARCMANLDAACNGCPLSRDAVLTALSNLQKQARADAQDVARAA